MDIPHESQPASHFSVQPICRMAKSIPASRRIFLDDAEWGRLAKPELAKASEASSRISCQQSGENGFLVAETARG